MSAVQAAPACNIAENTPPQPPPPLPPPPPPPCTKTETRSVKNIVLDHLRKINVTNDDNIATEIIDLCQQLDARTHTDDVCYFYFARRGITPVLQKGPTCGLVALSMASQVICSEPIPPEDIFDTAYACGFTKQGEMFSCEDLLNVSVSKLHCSGTIVHGSTSHRKRELFSHLKQDHIIIIPYDRDGNNEPCFKQGRKAHWAVLHGVVLCTKDQHASQLKKLSNCDEPVERIYQITTADVKKVPTSLADCSKCSIYVLAKQGKSRKSQLWNMESLLESNGQLMTVDPEILADSNNYIIKDLHAELNARFIILL